MKFFRPAFLSAGLLATALAIATPAQAADGKGTAYVSNQNGDVTVIDLATLETIAEFDVGAERPRAALASPPMASCWSPPTARPATFR